jgi:ABC-type polysaccharide/polyol phosphate export permease
LLGSLVQYRQFIWQRALQDLRHRYAGTGMGMAWNVIHPLGVIAVYSIVFTRIMNHQLNLQGKLAYTVYLCCGFFPWLAFCDCVTRGCNSFIANANYLKKLPIPEQVFVAQNAVASTLSLGINYLLLMVVAVLLGVYPSWGWLLLPVPLVMLQLMGFGAGMMLGTLNVFFRDVGEWTAIVLQMLMWTLPIVYATEILPVGFQRMLKFHPLMPAVGAIHDLFFYHRMPGAGTWVAMVAWPMGMIVLAGAVLHKLRPEIRDVI